MPAPPGDEAALLAQIMGGRAPAAAGTTATPSPVPPAPVRAPVWRIATVVAGTLIALLLAGQLLGTVAASWPPAVQTAAMSAILVALALAAGRMAGADLFVPGEHGLRWSAIGAAIGLCAIGWCALSLALGGRLVATVEPAGLVALWGVAITLVQVAGEEMLFRGAIQPAIGRVLPPLGAIAATGAVFALLHLPGGWSAPLGILNIFLAGCWLGLLAERSGGLSAPIAAHWGWNAGEMNVFGLFPNPGVGPWGALWGHDIVGSAAWGGGEEGLNGSFLATLVLGGITLVLLALRRKRAA